MLTPFVVAAIIARSVAIQVKTGSQDADEGQEQCDTLLDMYCIDSAEANESVLTALGGNHHNVYVQKNSN